MRITSCIKHTLIGLACLFSLNLWSQTPSIKWEGGISANYKFDEKWSLNTQLLGRETFNVYGSEIVEPYLDRLEIRSFLTYAFFNQRKMSFGYMYRGIEPFRGKHQFEHRITQQFAFLSNIRAFRLAHRFRAEERIFENDFVLRLRYRLSYDKPLQGESLDPGELYFVTSNEFVFSFNSSRETWQNRISMGIGKLFANNRKLQFSLTYRYSDFLSSTEEEIYQFKTVYYFNL